MSLAVSEEARANLEAWPKKSRALFFELLEDAGSELQQELLGRAVAAGHSPAEVHAFADELRGFSDEEAYEACTLHDAAPEDYTVTQLLRAEADPLFAFELKGGTLEPNETADAGSLFTPPPPRRDERRDLDGPPELDPLTAGLARKKPSESFEEESDGARAQAWDWNALGGSAPPPPSTSQPAVSGPRLLEGLLAEATRALGVSWKEHDVDVAGGLSLEEALATAAGALTRGIPVPCAVGPRAGEHRRFVLLLQLNTSGRNRAWQLYDPFSRELVWANEGDLLSKAELPFANKANRRLTRIALPQNFRASF